MRTILVIIILFLFFTLTLPLDLFLLVLRKINRKKAVSISQAIVRWTFRVLLTAVGADITVEGLENLPDNEAVLFVGNHKSYFDILVTCIYIKNGVGYIAKKEMEKIPLLNFWMRNINCLFLNRTDVKEGLKTILDGVQLLKEGNSLFIFPEGTRSKEEGMLPFKEGSTKMAEKSKSKIIPVAISGSANLFENNHALKVTPAKVFVTFGKPVDPTTLEKEQKRHLGAYLQKQIQEMIDAQVK
ncbi:MAG: lysophospholipid acyltransferase family protein [Lachnospiraceae bacterium]